jgi:Ras-related protein Rab-5C
LVGNKCDLAKDENRRKVSTKEAQNFSTEQNLIYFEVSAKSGENIDETFMKITEQFFKEKNSKNEEETRGDFIVLSGDQGSEENKKIDPKGCSC